MNNIIFSATSTTIENKDNCNHQVEVKFVNGEYISYCTKCGKILNRKKTL